MLWTKCPNQLLLKNNITDMEIQICNFLNIHKLFSYSHYIPTTHSTGILTHLRRNTKKILLMTRLTWFI